jgi:hypothetical protein
MALNKVAIAYFTKDRVDLTRRTLTPLLQPCIEGYDLWWFDGSDGEEGKDLCIELEGHAFHEDNVRGGPDAAVAYALTILLNHEHGYDYIGLVENDVLLPDDWFDRTFALFKLGIDEGLQVGAVSTRAYLDRVLAQRDGYALMHNLGWGTQIMTREAATLALRNMRTGWTLDNRRIFSVLADDDIGRWWAFRAFEHNIGPDWWNDAMLANHGYASLALTPSPVEMIGQNPPLADQGLAIVTRPDIQPNDKRRFVAFKERSALVRNGELQMPNSRFWRGPDQSTTIYAHQLGHLGARWEGYWTHRAHVGAGPFARRAASAGSVLRVPVLGPCSVLLTGGDRGAHWKISAGAFRSTPSLPPEGNLMWVDIPDSGASYREVMVEAGTPGGVIYGIRCRDDQPRVPYTFDWSQLPRIE